MALDWTSYDRYFVERTRQQAPMDAAQRTGFEEQIRRILNPEGVEPGRPWGFCSAPGVFSYTVVHVPKTVRHRYSAVAPEVDVGLKIVKGGPGPSPESIIHFQKNLRPQVPGLPHPLVQEVYDAGVMDGWHFVVQEWIHGPTLDTRLDAGPPLTREEARGFITDYFVETLLPLWSAGCIFWDHRPANLVITQREGRTRLVMIDTDTLAACAKEMVETPLDFTHRDRVKVSRGLARVKTMIQAIHESALSGLTLPRKEMSARRKAMAAAIARVQEALKQPGLPPNDPQLFAEVIQCL